MSAITKERVAEIIHAAGLEPYDCEEVFGSIKTGEVVAMARIALASLEAEAVAWRCGSTVTVNKPVADDWKRRGFAFHPLYAAPPAPVSVPDEVTTEDCPAFVKYDVTDVDEAWSRGWNGCRVAMLREVK